MSENNSTGVLPLSLPHRWTAAARRTGVATRRAKEPVNAFEMFAACERLAYWYLGAVGRDRGPLEATLRGWRDAAAPALSDDAIVVVIAHVMATPSVPTRV